MISLALTELAFLIGEDFVKLLGRRIICKCFLRRKNWKEDVDSSLSDFSIWLVYNKAVHWLILLYNPFFVLVVPIIDYLAFIYIEFSVNNFYRKAPKPISDIG